MDPVKLMAQFILQVVNRSTMPTDDQTQQNLQAAKGWLRALESGALVVVNPAVEATPAKKGKK